MLKRNSISDIPSSAAPSPFVKKIYRSRQRVLSKGSIDSLDHRSTSNEGSSNTSSRQISAFYNNSVASSQFSSSNLEYSPPNHSRPPTHQDAGGTKPSDPPLVDISDEDPYDLTVPSQQEVVMSQSSSLESQSLALFSDAHLRVILDSPNFLREFISFIEAQRHSSLPILRHYLDCIKALNTLNLMNAIVENLCNLELQCVQGSVMETSNMSLIRRIDDVFKYLVEEELPAFITHRLVEVTGAHISSRILGGLPSRSQESGHILAEAFCLTDPRRTDNPIVFASQGFHQTTHYGLDYILGRNCRFLQGPHTNSASVRRLREAIKAGVQHQEVFLNYCRNGSPFLNLLMMAPLRDSQGSLRYFIGAQIDVSALLKDDNALPSFSRLWDLQRTVRDVHDNNCTSSDKDDALQKLGGSLSRDEISKLQQGSKSVQRNDEGLCKINDRSERRVVIEESAIDDFTEDLSEDVLDHPQITVSTDINGRLSGIFQHYFLVRPYPSLRILFASPSQRIPGILQTCLMSRIGGTETVRDEIRASFAAGRSMTAKVRWLTKSNPIGRRRWIHCTPLIGFGQQVGVWMIVLVDDEKMPSQDEIDEKPEFGRRAPPIMDGAMGAALHGLTTTDILPFASRNGSMKAPTAKSSTNATKSVNRQTQIHDRAPNLEWNVSRDLADKLVIGDFDDRMDSTQRKAHDNVSRSDFAYPAGNGSCTSFTI